MFLACGVGSVDPSVGLLIGALLLGRGLVRLFRADAAASVSAASDDLTERAAVQPAVLVHSEKSTAIHEHVCA